ncbi:MAG: carboxyl transferase domain-containing protein [Actinomycetota bacterium]
MRAVAVNAQMPGTAAARWRDVGDGRRAMVVEVVGDGEAARISASSSAAIEAAANRARNDRAPLIFLVETTGVDIVGGIGALDAWGRAVAAVAACSGVVPTVAIVDGPAVSGPALLLGVVDAVVMTERAYAFVNGPAMVEQYTGVPIDRGELGAASLHERYTGVATLVAADRDAALEAATELLAYLPDHVDAEPPRWPRHDPPDRDCPDAAAPIPPTSTGSYDMRRVAAAIVDDDSMLELRPRWAANVITALATIDGRPVGIVANQPMVLAGTLDIPASQKAARFVAWCDALNLPLLTLVDTPGFYPGKDLEWRGMIRHGAQLVYAYARATVPRLCVIVRKSYGGAYIVMDSKTMGNDICLAWPWAELAVMGAGQAAAVLMRRATEDERRAYEADYTDRLLNPYVAAARGYVDAVIDPADTRRELCAALDALAHKRELLVGRTHGNEPL